VADPHPHEVLGVAPNATPEEIAAAYRELAKRFHPDVAGDEAVPRMAEINAAYDLLRNGLADDQRSRLRDRDGTPPPPPRPARPGEWLAPAVRRRLGRELLRALEPGEEVLLTADAATWDSHDVRLAVTDRRLLWLRDDAISDRVRYERWSAVRRVEGAVRRRLRRVGELRVETASGRRLAFGELEPARLEALLAACGPLVG
jgi:hypothetical protein